MRNQLPEQMKSILTYVNDSQKFSSSVQVLHVIPHRARDPFDRSRKQFGPLHVGVYWGFEKIFDSLLETGIDISSQDSNGATALLMAAKYDHEEGVQVLLSKGADVNAKDDSESTALDFAVSGT